MSALIENETGTQRLIGYVLDVGGGDGCARCWLDVGPQHLNRHGVMHGGLLALLLDSAMGATASLGVDATGQVPFATISMANQFIAPTRAGRVIATGRRTGGGRALCFVEGTLREDGDAVLATALGVFTRAAVPRPWPTHASTTRCSAMPAIAAWRRRYRTRTGRRITPPSRQ